MTVGDRCATIVRMKASINEAKIKVADLMFLDRVRYKGMVLPPRRLRFCGSTFQDDDYFLSSGRKEAVRLTDRFGLTVDSSILDVGCGQGRLPIGILDRVGEVRKYRGVDVDETSIRWCQRYISRKHKTFQFDHINVKNARYNRSGVEVSGGFRFLYADAEFDIIYLYSVFSHMDAGDVRAYLREFRRILQPDGGMFLTAFVEEGVPNVTENPEGYRLKWRGRLHGVRYDKLFLESMLAQNGFRVDEFDYEAESSGQSGLYISRLW